MAVYLIAYDLINEAKGTFDYAPLWAELKRLNCHRTQYSLWLANLSSTPDGALAHFKRFVDKDDRLWVTQLRKKEYTYNNAIDGTNAWLAKNPAT